MSVSPARAILPLLVLGLALSACARDGDLGRRPTSAFYDKYLPMVGNVAAENRGEPVSPFMMTDDEKEWRDRAWRFLMPGHPRARFDWFLAELRIGRVLAPDAYPPAPDVYFSALMRESWRSSKPPYRLLYNDMAADVDLLDPLDRIAAQVAATDAIRVAGLPKIKDLTPTERDNALARVAENKALARWIDTSLGRRIDAYEFALQRLFIEIPEKDAVAAERMLALLKSRASMEKVPAVAKVEAGRPTKHYTPWGEDEVVPQK